MDVIYLDYRKAFDTVPHKRLLKKLKDLGISGQLLRWIESFLTDRTIRVRVGNDFSAWMRVLSGVPQGSVLGPLLFLLFVNEIPDWVLNNILMFADDTKIWRGVGKMEDGESLQEDLNRLMEWSSRWLLRFNAEKCKVMHVGHSFQTVYTLTDEGKTYKLQEIREEKDLGVYTTDNLKPSLQCSKAAGKAMSILGMINRNFKHIDTEDFQILYKVFVRPHLEYCVQAWSPYYRKDVDCLERVQRRATGMVRGMKNKSYTERLQILRITSLERRRQRGDLIEMYKILTGRECIDSNKFFQLADSEYNLRGHSLKLFKPRCRLSSRLHAFSQRSIDIWNALPQAVIAATSVNNFKSRLDEFWKCTDAGN